MNNRFLISPAYLLSLACLLVGTILTNTALTVLGWMVFIVGLGLNAMALVVLANRDQIRQAQRAGSVPQESEGRN